MSVFDLVVLPDYNVFASRFFTSEVAKGRKKAAAKAKTRGDNSDGPRPAKAVPKKDVELVQIELKRRQLLIQKSVEPCFCKSHLMCQGVSQSSANLDEISPFYHQIHLSENNMFTLNSGREGSTAG